MLFLRSWDGHVNAKFREILGLKSGKESIHFFQRFFEEAVGVPKTWPYGDSGVDTWNGLCRSWGDKRLVSEGELKLGDSIIIFCEGDCVCGFVAGDKTCLEDNFNLDKRESSPRKRQMYQLHTNVNSVRS